MRTFNRPAITISLFYILFVVVWICTTDLYLFGKSNELTPGVHQFLQTAKGVFFSIVIGAFIYFMVYRANKKLSRSDDEYQGIFLNNPNPMWIYDLETLAFLKVNKAALAIYGYSEKEFLSMTLRDIRPPEELDNLTKYLNDLTSQLSEARLWKHIKKNGDILIVQATNHFIVFHNRNCRLAVCSDVTDKQVLEERLIRSNTEMNMLINGITDGFYIVNSEFMIVKCNRELKVISGREDEDLEGKNLFDIFPESLNQYSHQQYLKALATKKAVHFENYNPTLKAWYRVSAYPFENFLSVFFRNISHEKANELRIMHNEQNLSALINNTEDLIWSIDSNFSYYTFNKQYKTLFYQYFQEEIWPGKSALPKKQPLHNGTHCKAYYERALNGESFSVDLEFRHPSGSIRHARIRFNPIVDGEDKVVGVGCSLQDVTESINHLRKIENQNMKLRNIAFIISHTVRAPLTNILGLSAAIDRKNVVSTNDLKYLEYIDYSAHQLDHIIKDIVHQTIQIEEEETTTK